MRNFYEWEVVHSLERQAARIVLYIFSMANSEDHLPYLSFLLTRSFETVVFHHRIASFTCDICREFVCI